MPGRAPGRRVDRICRGHLLGKPSAPDDSALGVVDFSIFPHLEAFPTNTLAHAERWAADIGVPAYAIDEHTAIKVVAGSVEVVSEGQWTRFGWQAPGIRDVASSDVSSSAGSAVSPEV